MKTSEGPWYRNDYNECGYRSLTSCGPVPAGTRRVALIGSSLSEGHLVEFPHTIAERLRIELSAGCGAPVDVQNLGANTYSGKRVLFRMNERSTLRPDAILLIVGPFDIEKLLDADFGYYEPGNASEPAPRGAFLRRISIWIKSSRAVAVLQHFLFRKPSVYVPLYSNYGDNADFLRPPFTSRWQERLRIFDLLLTVALQCRGKAWRSSHDRVRPPTRGSGFTSE